MNIKIKADNVYALFPKTGSLSYDQIYATLSKKFGSESIFAKRTPGAGFLQWDLPGDDWTPLSKVDPIMASEVEAERKRRFDEVSAAFGAQQQLAQKVLAVPNEDYIFFRTATDGSIEIKITAWGYKHPEKVGGGVISKPIPPSNEVQEVVVSFIYDGRPLSNYVFYVNHLKRQTGSDGVKVFGELPVGSVYEIQAENGQQTTITIVKGQREYIMDVTEFADVKISVIKDGHPLPSAECKISYWGHSYTLTTGDDGCATATLPLDREGGNCVVSVGGEKQQRPLQQPSNLFQFDLRTPEPAPKPDPNPAPEPHPSPAPEPKPAPNPTPPPAPEPHPGPKPEPAPDPVPKPMQRRFCPIIRIESNEGFIGRHYPIRVTIGSSQMDFISDDQGEVHLSEQIEGQIMRIDDLLIPGNTESYTLNADQVVYIFHIPYQSSEGSKDIKIRVEDEKGRPLSGATIFFKQEGHPNTIGYLDSEGCIYLSHGDYATNQPLSVVLIVGGEQYKPIVFELLDDENEYLLRAVTKPSLWNRLWEILLAILGFAGTFITYSIILDLLLT